MERELKRKLNIPGQTNGTVEAKLLKQAKHSGKRHTQNMAEGKKNEIKLN